MLPHRISGTALEQSLPGRPLCFQRRSAANTKRNKHVIRTPCTSRFAVSLSMCREQNPVPPNPMLVRLASIIWGSRLYRPAWKKLLCPARSRRNYRLVVTSERNQAMTLGLGVCRDTPGCRAVIRTPATDRPSTTSMLSNSSEDAPHRPTDNREAQISLTFPESSLPSDSGPPQIHMLD
jgi:hypothetical protein